MAESGIFRVGLRGFKKQDVLQYIDELQRENMERVSKEEQLRQQAEQAAAEKETQCVQAQERIAALEAEQGTFAEHAAKRDRQTAALVQQQTRLTALVQTCKNELAQANERSAASARRMEQLEREKEALKAELSAVRAADKTAECEQLRAQAESLRRDNARYAALIGDVGQLIVELRGLGQTLLERSCARGEACLSQAQATAASLETQAAALRRAIDDAQGELSEQQTTCEQRLDTLLGGLKAKAADASFFR